MFQSHLHRPRWLTKYDSVRERSGDGWKLVGLLPTRHVTETRDWASGWLQSLGQSMSCLLLPLFRTWKGGFKKRETRHSLLFILWMPEQIISQRGSQNGEPLIYSLVFILTVTVALGSIGWPGAAGWLGGTGLCCCWAQWHEFDSQDLHGRKRKPNPPNCPWLLHMSLGICVPSPHWRRAGTWLRTQWGESRNRWTLRAH